ASGLMDCTILANGLRSTASSVDMATILNRLPDHLPSQPPKQIPRFCLAGGLVFPYRNLAGEVNGFARVRPHWPRVRDGKPVKYEHPFGEPNRAYFPVGSLEKLRDGTSPVHVTEGEKKALALSQLDLAAVGLGGVWNWKVKGPDELI